MVRGAAGVAEAASAVGVAQSAVEQRRDDRREGLG